MASRSCGMKMKQQATSPDVIITIFLFFSAGFHDISRLSTHVNHNIQGAAKNTLPPPTKISLFSERERVKSKVLPEPYGP